MGVRPARRRRVPVVHLAGRAAPVRRELRGPHARHCYRREVSSLADVCVVLDTNAIWDNWLLKGLAWKVLAAKAAGDNPKIHVRFPQTVLDEATSKFQSEAPKRISQLKAAENFLENGAADDELEAIITALTEQSDGYRDTLEDKLTDYLQGQVLPYPRVSHADMTKRALERRPPFDDNGGGYHDSLIWLAALDEAESLGSDLIIVSNDNAFKPVGTGKGKDKTPDDGGAPARPHDGSSAGRRGGRTRHQGLARADHQGPLVAALAPPPAGARPQRLHRLAHVRRGYRRSGRHRGVPRRGAGRA